MGSSTKKVVVCEHCGFAFVSCDSCNCRPDACNLPPLGLYEVHIVSLSYHGTGLHCFKACCNEVHSSNIQEVCLVCGYFLDVSMPFQPFITVLQGEFRPSWVTGLCQMFTEEKLEIAHCYIELQQACGSGYRPLLISL